VVSAPPKSGRDTNAALVAPPPMANPVLQPPALGPVKVTGRDLDAHWIQVFDDPENYGLRVNGVGLSASKYRGTC
jgi:hypothetical protein